MSDIDSDKMIPSPYVTYPFMTEVEEIKGFTRKRFKLHKTLGHAKNALKGIYYRDCERKLYAWNEAEQKWKVLYFFYTSDPVKF